jgi:hypothetical protein
MNVDLTTSTREIKTISCSLCPEYEEKLVVCWIDNKQRLYIVVFDVKQCVVLNPKKPNSIIVHGNQDVKSVLYKLEVCLAYSYRNEKKL